jgi:hypothetical protein
MGVLHCLLHVSSQNLTHGRNRGSFRPITKLARVDEVLRSDSPHGRHDPSASLEDASRIIEHASRIRIALASCCPEAETFSLRAQAATVWTISQRGDDAPPSPDRFTPNASTASSTQPICRAWRAERPSVPRKNWPSDHASACIRCSVTGLGLSIPLASSSRRARASVRGSAHSRHLMGV